MRRSFIPFFLCWSFGFVVFTISAHATPVSDDLIKGSGTAVYYYGADGKRYAFPTEKTYFSWYADFSTVKTVSDAELAAYPLRGNVTYKPGTRLIKITTDPKVYAVAHGGILRWVQTEMIATALFGADWALRVDDLPDAFFTHYTVGTPIASASDFSPATEQAAVLSINADKALIAATAPIPATSTTTIPYTAVLTASNNEPLARSQVLLTVRATPSHTVQNVTIFFGNDIQGVCDHVPCTASFSVPNTEGGTAYETRAVVRWQNARQTVATSTVMIASTNHAVAIEVNPEIRYGSQRILRASVDPTFVAAKIELYRDRQLIAICDNVQTCLSQTMETSATGTRHTAHAIAYNGSGLVTIQSETKEYVVVTNERPMIAFDYTHTQLLSNEQTTIGMTASDPDGVMDTSLWLDGRLLKQCQTPTCMATVGPWPTGTSLIFIGKATDTQSFAIESSSTLFLVH